MIIFPTKPYAIRSSLKGKARFILETPLALAIHNSESRTLRKPTMVCLACLLPLFVIPIVNLIPLIFDILMGKLYRLVGWEYRKPERAPAACPIKPPVANQSNSGMNVEQSESSSTKGSISTSVEAEKGKSD